MNNQYDNILLALADLNQRGYSQNFRLTDAGMLCPQASKTFQANELEIVEFHRFEGETDMNDMAILYAIKASEACKGVLIDAFGTYANPELGDFLKAIPYEKKNAS